MNTTLSLSRCAWVGVGLVMLSSAVEAKVYRCTVNGETTYMDRPCVGTESETVSMSAPRADASVNAAAKANPVLPEAKPTASKLVAASASAAGTTPTVSKASPVAGASTVTTMPTAATKPTAAAKLTDAAKPTAAGETAGPGWRLAGSYSDHVKDSDGRHNLTRTSYGIECDSDSRLRPTVYGLNDRYSLSTPARSGKIALQGPTYASLAAAASAACSKK